MTQSANSTYLPVPSDSTVIANSTTSMIPTDSPTLADFVESDSQVLELPQILFLTGIGLCMIIVFILFLRLMQLRKRVLVQDSERNMQQLDDAPESIKSPLPPYSVRPASIASIPTANPPVYMAPSSAV